MYRLPWKYTIIRYTMSNVSWRGASEGCRPKLPRWPFSASGCTHTAGTDLDRCMVRNLGAESSFFVQRLTFFEHHGPHASWLPFFHPHRSSRQRLTDLRSSPRLSFVSSPHLQDTVSIHGEKDQRLKRRDVCGSTRDEISGSPGPWWQRPCRQIMLVVC